MIDPEELGRTDQAGARNMLGHDLPIVVRKTPKHSIKSVWAPLELTSIDAVVLPVACEMRTSGIAGVSNCRDYCEPTLSEAGGPRRATGWPVSVSLPPSIFKTEIELLLKLPA